jgi:hypothetical protein
MWKFFTGTQRDLKARPGKVTTARKQAIGESSEMAASSVCSEHKSRVIEPRNIQIAGTFVFMSTGAVPERRMPSAMVRPESTPAPPVQRSPLERAERCSSAAPPLPAFHGVGRGEGLVPLP